MAERARLLIECVETYTEGSNPSHSVNKMRSSPVKSNIKKKLCFSNLTPNILWKFPPKELQSEAIASLPRSI